MGFNSVFKGLRTWLEHLYKISARQMTFFILFLHIIDLVTIHFIPKYVLLGVTSVQYLFMALNIQNVGEYSMYNRTRL